ncbi:MAG: hypothetical protein P1U75_13560 [Antarcticimicrobium sp.]|uniref:hypothetical protein n=1 Tax=Antarcticimicrobium sp. TaxID=2824147 RepID=UPI002632CAFA|nr:hypothetical protein [Antarcticimicrobium sp.]MDF1717683.1 hypothetical protein [Antarcticimicrobium sp.]
MSRLHWILAVLEDLKTYASQNKLCRLEDHLSQAFEVARADLEDIGREGDETTARRAEPGPD